MKADWVALMVVAVVMGGVAIADLAYGTGGYLGALSAACVVWAALYFLQRRQLSKLRAQLASLDEPAKAAVLARLNAEVRKKLETSHAPRKNV